MSNRSLQYCTFHADDLFLGIDVRDVQEVIRFQKMTPVPLSEPSVSGLINLRGQIVTAVDLRSRLEMPPMDGDDLPMNVVVRDGENRVSLLVDRIGDVVEVSEELFEPSPSTVQPSIRELIKGAYKLPDQLLLILDTERVVSDLETVCSDSDTRSESNLPFSSKSH